MRSQSDNFQNEFDASRDRRARWRLLRCVTIWVVVLSTFCLVPIQAQELDEARRQLGPIQAELLWENLQASHQYLCGVKPKRSVKYRKSVVTLAPDESIDFLVPAHELVRVLVCDQQTDGSDVEIWTSNGSGLYRKQLSAVSADNCSIIAAPDQSGISIAKVWRPDHAVGPVTIAIFTSRRNTPKLLDYYQCQILDCDDQHEISDDRGGKIKKYSLLRASERKRLCVEGPNRLRFEARLKYGLDHQLRQTFWLRVYVDGVLDRVLSFDTLPQSRQRNFVDDCEQLIGRREFAYLDVDCGDQKVEIESSHPSYLRIDAVGLNLCRPARNRSFDLPDAENTEKVLSEWDAPQFDPATAALSMSFLRDDVDSRPFVEPAWDPYLNQQTIRGLARNNLIPHGGLRAYMWMRALATRHYNDGDYGDEITVPELAERIRGHYTFYRDLLPSELNSGQESRLVGFVDRKIRAPHQKKTETVIGQQHVPDGLSWLSETHVHRLTADSNSKLVYQTPDSLGASLLRVIVDQTHLQQGSRLMVRFDDRPPIELVVHVEEGVSSICQLPGRAEAALASLSSIHSRYDSGIVGGPLAMHEDPTPIIRAATAEFIKPANVSRIEVWLPPGATQEAYVGLQYLDGRKTELSESSYRHLNADETVQPAGSIHADANWNRFVRQELQNDSANLESLLKSHLQNFSSSIQESDQIQPPTEVFDDVTISEKTAQLMALAEVQQWPAVIEILSELVNHTTGDIRRNAILARANALQSAGEYFLADRERRGWFLYGIDPQLKRDMLEQLMVQAEDDESLKEMFAAVAAINNRELESELRLARQLMNNGHYRDALILMDSHEPSPQNTDILLRCAYQTRWWHLLDRTLKFVHSPEEKNLWKGLKEVYFGNYEKAHRLLQSAGPAGREWLQYWQQGDAIFKCLRSDIAGTRLNAISDWESWQLENPGLRRWREEPAAIKSCTGNATIYSQSRDLRSQFFRCDPTQPATIELHGPIRIKIEARPLHESDGETPINDWLVIQNANQLERVPIINNHASQTLSIDNHPARPGQLIAAELELPPGLNRIQLNPEHASLVFRVLSHQPEIRLPVLPPINDTTLAAVIKGQFGKPLTDGCNQNNCRDCIRLICLNRECCSVQLNFLAPPCGCGELHSAISYFEKLSFGEAQGCEGLVVSQDNPFTLVGMDDLYRQAIELARSVEPEAYYFEPNDRIRQAAALERLVKTAPDRAEIQNLAAQLNSGSSWTPFLQFDSRAGVFSKRIESWDPETPAIRIRKSLVSESLRSQNIVTGNSSLIFDVEDERPTHFVIDLQRPQVSFVPLSPTVAIYRSRNDSQQITLANSDSAVSMRAELPRGPQQFEILHGSPLANHYIAAQVREVFEDEQEIPLFQQPVSPNAKTRTYQVATFDEPIRFTVASPKLIRIDKLEDGRTITELIPVLEDQTFELKPNVGEEGMYRIFELEFNSTPLPSYRPKIALEPKVDDWAGEVVQAIYQQIDDSIMSDPIDVIGLRAPDLAPVPIQLQDDLKPGLQEFGTLGLETGYVRRLAFEEFPAGRTPEQFFDLRLARYHYDSWRDRYTHTEFLLRPRIDSGPSYGFIHRGSTSIPLAKCKPNAKADGWGDFDVAWSGSFYNQFAGTPMIDEANSLPWSLGFNALISRRHQINQSLRHRPTLNLFGRALSETVNGFGPGELDQDIYTRYKADHPYGLRLSDRFIYQNCLDRRFWIRPQLITNADQLVPDNLGFYVGTDQLVGPLQLRAAYRFTNYFADNDRRAPATQNVFYLDCMLERWHSRDRRSELLFSLRNDLGDGSTSLGINLASFLNQARGYRDFQPATRPFLPIREERYAKQILMDR